MTNDQITLKILSERIQRRRDAGDHEADAMAFVAGELSMMLATVTNLAMTHNHKDARGYLLSQLRESPQGRAVQTVEPEKYSRMGYGGN
jgi:hypothetical protein